jgi:hypothetical protein
MSLRVPPDLGGDVVAQRREQAAVGRHEGRVRRRDDRLLEPHGVQGQHLAALVE